MCHQDYWPLLKYICGKESSLFKYIPLILEMCYTNKQVANRVIYLLSQSCLSHPGVNIGQTNVMAKTGRWQEGGGQDVRKGLYSCRKWLVGKRKLSWVIFCVNTSYTNFKFPNVVSKDTMNNFIFQGHFNGARERLSDPSFIYRSVATDQWNTFFFGLLKQLSSQSGPKGCFWNFLRLFNHNFAACSPIDFDMCSPPTQGCQMIADT